jgi:tetratricopeptide (TPR) repeat protein
VCSSDLNPNVITDLGIMYRKVGQFQKAIETFNRAITIDPQAKQARFNKGIVQLYDLGDKSQPLAVGRNSSKLIRRQKPQPAKVSKILSIS